MQQFSIKRCREICLVLLAVEHLSTPLNAMAQDSVTDETLNASPLEIWREFLRQEEEAIAENAAQQTDDGVIDSSASAPLTFTSDPLVTSIADEIVPPLPEASYVSEMPSPVPFSPDVHTFPTRVLTATPDTIYSSEILPNTNLIANEALPEPERSGLSGWSPLVLVQDAVTTLMPAPAVVPDTKNYSGWVTYLSGPPARETASHPEAIALDHTATAFASLDNATGIRILPEELFVALETLPAPPSSQPIQPAPDFLGPTMSLNDLADQVLSDDLEIRIRKARTLERGYNVDVARAGGRPTLSLTAASGPSLDLLAESEESIFNAKGEIGLTLDYNLYDFGRSRYEIIQAQRSLDSATAETENEANDKLYDVFDTLLRVGQIAETTTANETHLARLEELRALIQINVKEGNGTSVDIKRVDSRIEATQSGLIGLRSQRANAVSSFRRQTGLEADSINFAELYSGSTTSSAFRPEDILANPDIRASDAEIASLSAQEEAVRRGRLPNLTVQSGFNYNSEDMFGEEDTFDAELSLRLGFELYDGGASAGRRGQLRAQRTEAELRRLRKLRKIEEEAENIATFTQSQNEKTTLLKNRVTSLENVASLYREQFGIGARTVFEMLESEADLLAARMELTAHLNERARSSLQKLRLQGELIAQDWSKTSS